MGNRRRGRPAESRADSAAESTADAAPNGPVRTCIGCRSALPIHELVRLARGADGIVLVVDASAGRGAWLCRTPTGASAACVATARKRNAFARAFRSSDATFDDR